MTKHLRIILFAGSSLAFTLWIGLQIAGIDRGADRYELQATFEDATNLQLTDPVKLAGVPVGRVTSLRLERGVAQVTFSVDRSVVLPSDSVVAIRSQDLLGRRILRLEPGTASEVLMDGDTVAETESAVELGALINELGPLLEAVRPQQVNTLVNALNEALAGNQARLADTTVDLASLLDTLASRSSTIESLIDDYGVLSAEVAARDTQIQQLVDNLVLLTETFAASEQVLIDALDTLPGVADDLRVLLTERAADLDTVLGNLAAIGSDVRAQLDDVDVIAAGLPLALQDLFSIVDNGQFVNLDFACVATDPPPCPHPDLGDEQSDVPPDLTGLESLLDGLLNPAALGRSTS